MTDRRTFPCNGEVADIALEGQVDGVTFVTPKTRRVAMPLADLRDAPDGRLDRQMLAGDAFAVLQERTDGTAFGYALDGGYVGYVLADSLADMPEPTHWVRSMGTHAFEAIDIKSPALMTLPFGARLSGNVIGGFLQTHSGFVPLQALCTVEDRPKDFVAVAERLIDVPYLWGGDSHWGLDCSGLVHLARRICGQESARDSDQQADMGADVEEGALQRRDLVFWAGHVGIMQSPDQLLHANAHHMRVTSEPLDQVIARNLENGTGPVTVKRRV